MTSAFSAEKSFVYKEKNNFGLRQSDGTIVVKPEYKKLIPLGENSFIAQDNNKFGLYPSNSFVFNISFENTLLYSGNL